EYTSAFLKSIQEIGFVDPIFGFTKPDQVSIDGENYRETISAHGHNARIRAILRIFTDEMLSRGPSARVYAPESLTSFADTLRMLPPDFVGSEYLPTVLERARHPGVLHQDVMNLSFEDAAFDLYITCEVLEHVPDIRAKLRESRRVLKSGGKLIGTFPFHYGSYQSHTKAILKDGQIVHLTEPEYHGNPADPAGGSLVFTIPGWEVVEWAKEAGFSNAYFVASGSRLHAIRAAELAVVLAFVAEA
ncbi:methyltransferase domain-containing protein, partial [Xanthobacter sp. DSM 24535]|uniref:class I SAM-dependent methyltransferase n=1 Tax=Roseixanthobacter psychrophilus TaxID=3119917 RepID=UPI00372A498C